MSFDPPVTIGGAFSSPYGLKMRGAALPAHPVPWVLCNSEWDDLPPAPVPVIPLLNWIERVDDLCCWPTPDGDDAGWFAIGALSPAVHRLLGVVVRMYVPFMLANAAALESGADEVVCEIDEQEYRQPPFKYQGKCLRWVRQEYAALDDASLADVDAVLAGTGCEAILA